MLAWIWEPPKASILLIGKDYTVISRHFLMSKRSALPADDDNSSPPKPTLQPISRMD